MEVVDRSGRLPTLVEGGHVRLIVASLLYLAQGFPQGIFINAIPTWLAANGQSAAIVGMAVSAAAIPWTIKFLIGAVMDRYMWLPMGRRRPWLVGSQVLIAFAFLAYAIVSPLPTQTWIVIAFTFLISLMTATQDVALDALVIDVTPDSEMGRMNGFMFAGKMVGIAGGTAISGYFMQYWSIREAMLAMLALFAIPASLSITVLERPGEKRLPWTAGRASPVAVAGAPQAWLPILRVALASLFRRDALLVIALMFLHGVYQILIVQGLNMFFVSRLGWGEGQIGGFRSVVLLLGAGMSLTLGAFLVERVGPSRLALISAIAVTVVLGGIAASHAQWHSTAAITAMFGFVLLVDMLFYLSFLVLAMRVSAAEAAATSFALIAATLSLGSAIAGWGLGPLNAWGGLTATFGVAAAVLLLGGLAAQGVSRRIGAGREREDRPVPLEALAGAD